MVLNVTRLVRDQPEQREYSERTSPLKREVHVHTGLRKALEARRGLQEFKTKRIAGFE